MCACLYVCVCVCVCVHLYYILSMFRCVCGTVPLCVHTANMALLFCGLCSFFVIELPIQNKTVCVMCVCVCACARVCVCVIVTAPPPFVCPTGKWECPGGSQVCINITLVCNGKIDCPEGHDESPICSECLPLLSNPCSLGAGVATVIVWRTFGKCFSVKHLWLFCL